MTIRMAHIGCAVFALSVCLLSACGTPQTVATPTALSKPPTAIPPTFKVQTGPVIKRIQFSARVQAKNSAELYFETDGRVLNVAFREGDSVKQGDTLAELDVSDLRNELDQKTVEYQTAQIVLSNTVKGYTRTLELARLDVDQAKLRLQISTEQSNGADVRLAQNDLDRNQRQIDAINASIKKARSEYDQAGADNAAKVLEDAQLDRDRLQAAYDRAVANQRVQTLQATLLQKDLDRAQLNYQTILSNVDPNLVSAVERSRLAVEGLRKRLGRSTLVAPFDGIIASQTIRAASNVRALDPVVTLAKPGELDLVASLTAVQASQIDIAARVTCYFENDPNTALDGFVREFPKMPPNATNQNARIQLPKNVKLEISRLARCITVLGLAERVLWLPPAAVRSFQGRRFVVIQTSDGKQQRMDVDLGLQADDRIEIKSGVKEGDVIIAP